MKWGDAPHPPKEPSSISLYQAIYIKNGCSGTPGKLTVEALNAPLSSPLLLPINNVGMSCETKWHALGLQMQRNERYHWISLTAPQAAIKA